MAAAGKKSTTSLSLFMETFGFEVEEEHSTVQRRVQFEGCVAEPLTTITPILPGSKVNVEETEYNIVVFVYGSIWFEGGGAFHLGHPVLGRQSLDGKMEPQTKRSMYEANSGRCNYGGR